LAVVKPERRLVMPKIIAVPVAAALAGLILLAAPGAFAKSGPRVIETGSCSAASDWKLKIQPEDGRLEVEYEVDQNVSGQKWRVVLRHNGDRFARVVRTTQPPSGSFEVRRLVNNRAGDDTIRGRATNLKTGQVCRGKAVFPA
jgi:hypothetical protein